QAAWAFAVAWVWQFVGQTRAHAPQPMQAPSSFITMIFFSISSSSSSSRSTSSPSSLRPLSVITFRPQTLKQRPQPMHFLSSIANRYSGCHSRPSRVAFDMVRSAFAFMLSQGAPRSRASAPFPPTSVFGHLWILLDHLNAGIDVFLAFFGQLAEIIESEPMNVAQLLVDDDEPAADEHHAAEALMAHLQHRRDHHAGRPLDGKAYCVEKKLEPPNRIRIGIAHDRERPAFLLVDDVRLEQI